MTKILQSVSPIDGSLYAAREASSLQELRDALERARKAQKKWAGRPIGERIALLRAGVDEIGKQRDRMATELAWQIGRPVRYGGEFVGFKERADYMAEIAEKALAPIIIEENDRFLRKIERRPQGVGLVIAPWNYPYMTAINAIAPALIAGNSVLLKHATQSLLVGEHMTQAFHKAGIPKDVLQNLFADHETITALIKGGGIDFINFTGSVGGGETIERAGAGQFIALATELGGKDPAYIADDADLGAAVAALSDAAFYNSGQSCCGIERIYVHEKLYEDFVERMVAGVNAYKLGNPLESETTLGPMAHRRFAHNVRAQINEALRQGAHPHIKKFPEDDGETYLTPQILTSVTHNMRLMREETFGPVVGIMKVGGDEEAIDLMNDSPFGLTASIWTGDVEKADHIGHLLQSGTIFMNRADYLDPALCWSGYKKSGRGTTLSSIGYHALTRPQSYHFRKAITQ